jgi:hypothetical protein
VATLYIFGLKRGVGADSISEFFCRLRLESHVGCSPSALRGVMDVVEQAILETTAAWDSPWRDQTDHRCGGRNLLGTHEAGVHGPGQRVSVMRRGGRGS